MFDWVKNKVPYSPKKDFLIMRTRFQGSDSQKGALKNAINWYFTRSGGELNLQKNFSDPSGLTLV